MKQDTERRLLELTGLLCDESISEKEFAELDRILGEDPEAREIYRSFLGMHQHLATGALESEETPKKPFQINLWIPAIGLAASIAVAAFFLLDRKEPPVETVSTLEPTPDFVLTRAIDVEWEHATRFQAKLGEPISKGHLRLKSGIAQIQFASGATVTIEGPAKLRLDGPMKCYSHYGKLAAFCPPPAQGFMIRFNGGRVIDLGTEFALNTESDGKTDVHVLDGEVIVEKTNGDDQVVKKQNLTENSAVAIGDAIENLDYNGEPFEKLTREHLLRSQPIKLQFDIGHRAGLYHGINSPAHATGDLVGHENTWTQIVGDQSGTFALADGNLCPYPIRVDYGHGDGTIDWDATPVDPWGRIYSKAKGVWDTALSQDHRPWDEDLGLRVSGLPKGTYRIYALCRSVRRPGASYDVSFGVNIDQQLSTPTIIPKMEETENPTWVEGQTYAVGEVTVSGPEDWATFITRYSRERSLRTTPHHGRSVLLGLQIVQLK